jgi:hypothetical protein
MLLDDFRADPQSKPRARLTFRGEERFEELGLHFRGNAVAGVSDGDSNTRPMSII